MSTPQPAQPDSVSPILLAEILGFSPTLLLDDIIDIANDAIRLTVDAMEEFILRWVEERLQSAPSGWDGRAESELGIISLQTLLESHADVAFDAFEAWSLRNIFTFAPELPVVVPHQEGLNLRYKEGEEVNLMNEIDELRRKIEIQRRLKRLLTRAVRKSAIARRKAETHLSQLSSITNLESLNETSAHLEKLYKVVSVLPPPDPELAQVLLRDPGKRQWEISRAGYLNWAKQQLMNRERLSNASASGLVIDERISGNPDDIRAALDVMDE